MNGRIYDPRLARFLQADPLIEDGSTLNRYTYVHNDPLAWTDPSGYWGRREQNALRTVVAVAIAVFTGIEVRALVMAGKTGQAFALAVAGGAVSGGIQSGTVEGAAWGAFSAGVFFGIGQGLAGAGEWARGSFLGSELSGAGFAVKTVSHGLAGGTISHLQGGKFGHGFVSAAGSAATAPLVDSATAGGVVQGAIVTTLVGGTLSRLSGGKFANGAVTSAFSYALSSAGRVGGADEGGATTCASGECPALPGEQLIAGPLEYLTPTRVWFPAGPGITYVDGYSWLTTWSGAAAGESSAQYWADLHVQTGNPLYAVPGVFASLWTPDTALRTAFTLVTAGGGSVGFRFGREITFGKNVRIAPFGNRTGHRYGELPHYHRRGIDPATGQTLPGQGVGRHRPWEVKSTDRSWWERF
jgi:hypothetical protein